MWIKTQLPYVKCKILELVGVARSMYKFVALWVLFGVHSDGKTTLIDVWRGIWNDLLDDFAGMTHVQQETRQ